MNFESTTAENQAEKYAQESERLLDAMSELTEAAKKALPQNWSRWLAKKIAVQGEILRINHPDDFWEYYAYHLLLKSKAKDEEIKHFDFVGDDSIATFIGECLSEIKRYDHPEDVKLANSN